MNDAAGKTIIIADDHPLFLSGIRMELEKDDTLNIIAEAGDGKTALELIKKYNPDVAVLDFEMPELTGLEIAKELQKSGSPVKIILLTMHNEKKIFLKALEIGIKGYVLKNDAVIDIFNAVNCVIGGGEFISPKLIGLLLEKGNDLQTEDKMPGQIVNLTQTEKNILKLIAELDSNEEIAGKLFISKRTVENQRVIISQKLDLEGAKDLLKFAVKHKDYL